MRAEIFALAHVQGMPDILQQVRQWHFVNVFGNSVPVNRTDPHWQLAVKRFSASLLLLIVQMIRVYVVKVFSGTLHKSVDVELVVINMRAAQISPAFIT